MSTDHSRANKHPRHLRLHRRPDTFAPIATAQVMRPRHQLCDECWPNLPALHESRNILRSGVLLQCRIDNATSRSTPCPATWPDGMELGTGHFSRSATRPLHARTTEAPTACASTTIRQRGTDPPPSASATHPAMVCFHCGNDRPDYLCERVRCDDPRVPYFHRPRTDDPFTIGGEYAEARIGWPVTLRDERGRVEWLAAPSPRGRSDGEYAISLRSPAMTACGTIVATTRMVRLSFLRPLSPCCSRPHLDRPDLAGALSFATKDSYDRPIYARVTSIPGGPVSLLYS